jgi:hypothetical protein
MSGLHAIDECYGTCTADAVVCGEPAISLHSHHVSLVQWTNSLRPVTRDLGSNPLRGDLRETRILLLALSRYIGDPNVIDHHGLISGGLRPKNHH